MPFFIDKRDKPCIIRSMNALNKLQTISQHLDLQEADGCHWQAIMNVGYSKWQDGDFNGYNEMVCWMMGNYGPLAAMAVLLGKFNQQVCNGGHAQYWDNGYASSDGMGCMHNHKDMDNHKMLLDLVGKHLDIECKDALIAILRMFDVDERNVSCEWCNGTGVEEEEDEDGNCIEIECDICSGSGESEETEIVPSGNLDYMDEQYYKINELVEKQTTKFFKNLLS